MPFFTNTLPTLCCPVMDTQQTPVAVCWLTLRLCSIGDNRFNLNQFWLMWLKCTVPENTFQLIVERVESTAIFLGIVITVLLVGSMQWTLRAHGCDSRRYTLFSTLSEANSQLPNPS